MHLQEHTYYTFTIAPHTTFALFMGRWKCMLILVAGQFVKYQIQISYELKRMRNLGFKLFWRIL